MVKVDLISYPSNSKKIIYTACRTCYSIDIPFDIWAKSIEDEKVSNLIKRVIGSEHLSTVEHINFVFTVSGITRKTSHQLVRHRHCSFSQKSQRYVTYHKPFNYNIPDSILKNPTALNLFKTLMDHTQGTYARLIELGIEAEDARDVLPNACHTDLVMTCNLRQLMHLASLRLCACAQKEIRVMVKQMVDAVIAEEPWLKEYLVPKCEIQGYCNEFKSCGRKPKKQEG